MLVARTQLLRGLICVGLVTAFANPAWACDGCNKAAAAKQSATLAAAKAVAPTFVLSGVTEKNAWSVMQAVAKLGGAVTLDATTAKATIPWNNGQDLLLSKIQKALEGTGASIDENRWTLAGPVRLHVAGMTCGSCAGQIKGALSKLDGVDDITVDLRSKEEGYVRFSGSGVTYGAIRKAVAGTPFRLLNVSLAEASGCCGGTGCGCDCCGTKTKTIAGVSTKTDGKGCCGSKAKNVTLTEGKGCCGGAGCGCGCCGTKANKVAGVSAKADGKGCCGGTGCGCGCTCNGKKSQKTGKVAARKG